MEELLKIALQYQASDIHLAAKKALALRVDKKIVFIKEFIVTTAYLKALFKPILKATQWEILSQQGEIDFSWELKEQGRLRINLYKQQGDLAAAIRILPLQVPSFKELGLPEIIEQLAEKTNGLLLVTGATGSGKTTTLAAIVEYINKTSCKHIVTLEDPIEYRHESKLSLISQRAVAIDTKSFNSGLKAALREDPDVILVGELRDLETLKIAITAAETGHLVLGSLHTIDATQTINRIIDSFPAVQQEQIRIQLSFVLQGIIAQKLLIGAEKMLLAVEVLVANTAIKNLIRMGKIEQINSFIQTSKTEGMCSLESSLKNLYLQKQVKLETLLASTDKPELLKRLLEI